MFNLLKDSEIQHYISSGCNRNPYCIDWGHNNLICFGACNGIAIHDPLDSGHGLLATLPGHKMRVNSVCWIRSLYPYHETELVSASSDKSLIVWALSGDKFIQKAVLSGHTMTVNIVDALYINGLSSEEISITVIVSASADSTVRYWFRDGINGDFECKETIDLKSGVCVSLCLMNFPNSGNVLLAAGMDDSKIHLYCGSEKVALVGHEDWVRCLAFTFDCNEDVLLASGSQDCSIRLWRLAKKCSKEKVDAGFKPEEQFISIGEETYFVTLESVLFGHEGWVHGLQWKPRSNGSCLASCSLDRTLLLWSPDPESGVWLETCRLGELGGNTLGYLGVKFSPDAETLIANSYQGALHMWKLQEEGIWKTVGTTSGHFDGVMDIAWERDRGRYLLSSSLDQTTRLHAPWNSSKNKAHWYEMSRPQVHGHAMSGLAHLPNFMFASCSEEKVVRIFKAPQNILHNLSNLMVTISRDEVSKFEGVLGGAVPSLGLSNKAVLASEHIGPESKSYPKEEFSDGYFTPQELTEPPAEDNLTQNTLWPEIMKLYGHGYEVYTVAATWKGDILATASKASTAEHAKILLWESETWVQFGELEGHTLTVTQMEFAPDDSALISVSRDRTWCLFTRIDNGYVLTSRSSKASNPHSRIIWTCGWSDDGAFYATGSRDGKVAIWTRDTTLASAPLIKKLAVTAVAFPKHRPSKLTSDLYLLAVGMENGCIEVLLWKTSDWMLLLSLPHYLSHQLDVKRILFRPFPGTAEDCHNEQPDTDILQLASCSMDHSVRVFTFNIKNYFSVIK